MKKIIKPRQSGKTTELIQMSHDNWNYIVCASTIRANQIAMHAKNIKIRIPFPITIREFIEHRYNEHGIKGFLIDDLDQIIQNMSSLPINAITMTEE